MLVHVYDCTLGVILPYDSVTCNPPAIQFPSLIVVEKKIAELEILPKTEPLKPTRIYEGLTDVEGEGGVGRGGAGWSSTSRSIQTVVRENSVRIFLLRPVPV